MSSDIHQYDKDQLLQSVSTVEGQVVPRLMELATRITSGDSPYVDMVEATALLRYVRDYGLIHVTEDNE